MQLRGHDVDDLGEGVERGLGVEEGEAGASGDEDVLELLEDGVLDDGVDDEHEGGADAAPEGSGGGVRWY